MVDEYQDTNPVQARIAGLVAGLDPAPGGGVKQSNGAAGSGNIMVVGDDAQSIYAFRGADVRNILRFPDQFPGAKVIRLEENYRSTQPVLNLSNAVLENASEGYAKRLFTRREGSARPNIVRPMSGHTQAEFAAARIVELSRLYKPGDIAVLVRAGFHSFPLEVALNKMGISFRKYGGIRFTEAAHIKDVMSFVRLGLTPLDFTAFTRMAELSKGVGSKTCLKIYQLVVSGDAEALSKVVSRYPDLADDLAFIDLSRRMQIPPATLLSSVVEHYSPRLELLYPDDYPRRLQELEELIQTASPYKDLDMLVATLSLEDPVRAHEEKGDSIVISTIHSAKGLEWAAVLVLDLVEERFPSRHAMVRPEDFEEERRLMYVACTRAKDSLDLYVPASVYTKGSGSIPAVPSPFVRELASDLYVEWQESYIGGLAAVEKKAVSRVNASAPRQLPVEDAAGALGLGQGPAVPPSQCGFCRHSIFGRGKIVQHLPPDKYRVNFPGIGLKVIMAAYLTMED
jgi:DNA helicase-2/ATP-dependent DNA helicase PcrA